MAVKSTGKEPVVRLSNRLSEAFDQMEEMIRERAYHIFLDREPGGGDSIADWFLAQSEMLRPVELDIKEQKNNVVAECHLEGFSPEEVEVEVENGVLKVFGTHRESSSQKKGGGTESTSRSVYFYQSAPLPAAVDLDGSHAKLFKNGKLKVTLPKPAAEKKSGKKKQ